MWRLHATVQLSVSIHFALRPSVIAPKIQKCSIYIKIYLTGLELIALL